MRWFIHIPAAAAGLLLCQGVLADCEMRDETAKEADHYKRVAAAMQEALGPAPAKWSLKVEPVGRPGGQCRGTAEGNFEVRLVALYRYQPSKEESARADAEERRLRKEIENLQELPPEVKKERQVWLDKMSEANRASNKAAKEGNKPLARDKDREAEGYSQKGREIRSRYLESVKAKVAALEAQRKAANANAFVRVKLVANPGADTRRDPGEGEEFLVGKRPGDKRAGFKVQGVLVMLESGGLEARRREIGKVIDREKLKRLVQ